MKKINFFIFTFLISLLVSLFYNCAPLTEKGNFVEESIRITGFDSQNDGGSDGSDDGGSDGSDDGGSDGSDDGGSDGSDDGGSDGSDDGGNNDGGSDGSTGNNNNNEPIGDEFGGSETPEEGPTPITRSLY